MRMSQMPGMPFAFLLRLWWSLCPSDCSSGELKNLLHQIHSCDLLRIIVE